MNLWYLRFMKNVGINLKVKLKSLLQHRRLLPTPDLYQAMILCDDRSHERQLEMPGLRYEIR